jgi:Calcineurin-like phosphoesterase
MMGTLLKKILRPVFFWIAAKFSAAPKREAVFASLSRLYASISTTKSRKGISIDINTDNSKFIIFSDQHKGANDVGNDFENNEGNYIAALNYYYQDGFTFINLGDAEELLKYDVEAVVPNNIKSLSIEAKFHADKRYYRTFGNHDLLWKNKADVDTYLEGLFVDPLPVYEGIVLKKQLSNQQGAIAISKGKEVPVQPPLKGNQQTVHIFLTHGHQGDTMSDNNAFSSWVIAHIWAPVQRFLQININTPANDYSLRDKHNRMMYEWSRRKKNLILITGHTHKPVFASGRYTDIASHKIDTANDVENVKPSYFNTGCCCFNDGDITGIEISNGCIRLIKWDNDTGVPSKTILEEKKLNDLVLDL